MRRLLVSAVALAIAAPSSAPPVKPPCAKRYTVHVALRYAHRVLPEPTTRGQESMLAELVRCQYRHPAAVRSWIRRHRDPPGWAIPASVVYCESGGRNLPPNSATASGYYQFIRSTWHAFGGARYADEAWRARKWQQDVIARRAWGQTPWDCA